MAGPGSDFFIADDLSGALDAAAAFHHAGHRVRVALTFAAWDGAAPDETVAYTTETRNAAPAVAAAAVVRALRHGQSRGERLVYKKIDSTLRGPVAAELAALAETSPATRILFLPANPRAGRTVRAGVLLVHGVPVAQTEFARDPANPVTESAVSAVLGPTASMSAPRSGGATPRVVVPDAQDEADLDAAVQRMAASPESWVGVGSGALARPVAAARGTPKRRRAPLPPLAPDRRILFVGGSAHPANGEQSSRLAAAADAAICTIPLGDPVVAAAAAVRALEHDQPAILQLEPVATERDRALRAITTAAQSAIRRAGVTRVFATGGETAHALCTALGVSSLLFRDEIEPGLCVADAVVDERPLVFAIKPGGFGDAQTWIRAWRALHAG